MRTSRPFRRNPSLLFWAQACAIGTCALSACGPGVAVNQPGNDAGTAGSTASGGSPAGSGGATGTGGTTTTGGQPGSGGGTTTGTGGAAAGTGGRQGTGGGAATGGTTATGGRAATGGGTATGGGSATGGSAGGGGRIGSGGTPGTGGAVGTGGSTGAGGAGACASVSCGTHRWACWRMPNPATAGLPNPASYTDLGDGTVRDNVTCLTWQKTVSSSTYSVAAGRAYCATLGTGWRLATRIEMMSIMDYTRSGAKVDPAFPSTPAAFYKTGSEWVLTTKQIGAGAGTDFGWAFNFSDGIVSNARSGATADRARCVRGSGDADLDAAPGALPVVPPNQYTAIATGEVQDNYTGLIWQAATSPTQMTFADAKTYCAGLALNGHTWRLPSIREASTLVDEAQVAPSINRTMFPGTKYGSRSQNWYWSGHNSAGSTTAAWGINFDDGFTGANTATDTGAWNYFTTVWARCVR